MIRLSSLLALVAMSSPLFAGDVTRTEDVIYGRKFGLAMTMDVFEPKENKNGAGVIFCVSGGFFSSKEAVNPAACKIFTDRGYVVFAVVHGSQPRFTIPEILDDMHRATRFIKHNASKWGVDPERLGITGGSAGGHLSLMQGNAFKPADPKAKDPIDRHSSRVAAIACFFPPTDFLNYSKAGEIALGTGILKGFRPPFDFWERNPTTGSLVVITDEKKRVEIGRAISPAHHVSKNSAPALIYHGDKDELVPIQQAELMKVAYAKAGVPFELVVKPGAGHGWGGMDKDLAKFATWFDQYLKK
ncbi:MAG: alpha/beta hydrolase [Gemmataceae bacterium]